MNSGEIEQRVAPCQRCLKFAFCLQVNTQKCTHRVVFKHPAPLGSAGNLEVQRVVPPGPCGATVNWGAICFVVISFPFLLLRLILPSSSVRLFEFLKGSPCFPCLEARVNTKAQEDAMLLDTDTSSTGELKRIEAWWNITQWTLNPQPQSIAADIKKMWHIRTSHEPKCPLPQATVKPIGSRFEIFFFYASTLKDRHANIPTTWAMCEETAQPAQTLTLFGFVLFVVGFLTSELHRYL